MEYGANVGVAKRRQLYEQRPGQQRRYNREGGVLGRGGNEQDGTVLDCGKEGILLGLRKAVNLIDKQDGVLAEEEALAGLLDNGADFLDTGVQGA